MDHRRPFAGAAWALLALTAPLAAQLTDLQPGRNFREAEVAFGAGRSENIDVGDVDGDGDLDVAVANGGDGAPQLNRLYVNAGGLQGGVTGDFADESATRFAGLPADRSRDLEFADVDADGDLDLFVSNHGSTSDGGQVSRAYVNLGGLQFGSAGFFAEGTDGFWGDLVSVPPTDEVGPQDGQGPFRDHSNDADFGDLDDDGDLDLFFSSGGLHIDGTRESRVFLNDGQGRFDELWPWIEPGADITLHTLDVDLVDLDGDFDLDVFASSRESQARVYRNDLGGAGALFRDVTQSALIDTGATALGGSHYESEFGDLDGDGDFDVWAVNYVGFGDRVLINDGALGFHALDAGILGDANQAEREVDFLDYDGDGDLDAVLANVADVVPGINFLYQSGLANGAGPQFHRTGTSAAGSQSPWPETPTTSNFGATLDGQCADIDDDGDPDILLANGANQNNRLWRNELGVPDVHAPTFALLTVQGDKTDGSETVIHAQLRDNAPYYVIAMYAVDLVWSVDGGFETTLPMTSQGSQQFRGVIPAALDGSVSYRVEASDRAGNTGVSRTVTYQQTSIASSPWQPFGTGTPGLHGLPHLIGRGALTPGALTELGLTSAAPHALDVLLLSAVGAPVPFKGGTLFASPAAMAFTLVTGGGGESWITFTYPPGVPSGLQLWWQHAVADATHPSGVALSNAVLSTAP